MTSERVMELRSAGGRVLRSTRMPGIGQMDADTIHAPICARYQNHGLLNNGGAITNSNPGLNLGVQGRRSSPRVVRFPGFDAVWRQHSRGFQRAVALWAASAESVTNLGSAPGELDQRKSLIVMFSGSVSLWG